MRYYSGVLWPAESKPCIYFSHPAQETPNNPEILGFQDYVPIEGFWFQPTKMDIGFGIILLQLHMKIQS